MRDSLEDLTGKKQGDLEILYYIGEKYWKCRCKCGKELNIRKSSIKKNYIDYSCKHTSMNKNNTCSNFVDLKGTTAGDYNIIEYIGGKGSYWLCRCKCGTERKYESAYIRNELQNYKCNHNKLSSRDTFIDLTGKQIGDLYVKVYAGDRKWKCICKCGKELIRQSYELRNNLSQYKCTHSDNYMNKHVIDLTNKEFGRLAVVKKYQLFEYEQSEFKSKAEQYIADLITLPKIINCKALIDNNGANELDIYIPSIKTAIEFNGMYWHSDVHKDKYYHQNKTIACAKQGIRLIHIFEHELKNESTSSKIISLIKDLNGVQKIYARDTVIGIETNEKEIKEFLNNNHLQGYIHSTINISLRCKDTNELVAVMTLGSPRFNREYQYEIHRLCFKQGIGIIGGTEKLFRYFIDSFHPVSILTYADISKFTGNSYLRLGFNPVQSKPITEPNYIWVNPENCTEVTRYMSKKKTLVNKGLGTEEQTENEIMQRLGFLKIYNSGNIKLEWRN